MGIELFVQNHDEKQGNAKNYIVTLLTEKKPLTVRELQKKVQKEFKYSVSYQAIRKANYQLVEEGVLEKNGKKYSISEKWIDEIYFLCRNLKRGHSKYYFESILERIHKTRSPQYLQFHSLCELKNYIEELEIELIPKLRDRNVFYILPMTQKGFNFEKVKERMDFYKMNSASLHLLYRSNGPINQLAVQNYTLCGAKAKIICENSDNSIIGVFDDIVFQSFIPIELILKTRQNGSGNGSNLGRRIMDYIEIQNKEANIRALIQRNENFAGLIKQKISPHFDSEYSCK